MISNAQVAYLLAFCSLANGFSPNFSTPRQCSSLSISWIPIELPISPVALSEITLSLIPLDNNPAHFAPEPYTLAVPCSGTHAEGGQVEIPRLPFPEGTQFFASAYIPDASGPVRRTVSKVFTVEHSSDRTCLNNIAAPNIHKRPKPFGMKRQVSVIGVSTVLATPGTSTNAAADPSATTTSAPVAAAPPITVLGVGFIPASDPGAVPSLTSSAAPSSTGAPIVVVGTSQIPASGGVDAPGNVAPAPSASGPIAPIQVIGTSLVSATSPPAVSTSSSDSAFVPNFTTVTVGSDGITAQGTNTEPPMVTETATSCTEDTSTADVASPTGSHYDDSSAVQYGSFNDMVNAANSMFHAWNPYKPAYTPST